MISRTKLENRLPSLIFWLEKFHRINSNIKQEDNTKFNRLAQLSDLLKIKYFKPIQLPINYFYDQNQKIVPTSNLYTWRIIPKNNTTAKIRMICKNIKEAKKWVKCNNIDLSQYKYFEVVPYVTGVQQSAIILINDTGIWGEMINSHIWRLAHGVHHRSPKLFYYQNKKLNFVQCNKKNQRLIKKMLLKMKVANKKQKLFKKIKSKFTPDGYLKGYFEVSIKKDGEIIFNDYNRSLYQLMKNFKFLSSNKNNLQLRGRSITPGMAVGEIINSTNKQKTKTGKKIVVCKAITTDHLPLLKKATAIISERGNALSHIAIILRELKKPYIVGVKNVTKQLKTGDRVFVNATAGTIIKL